MIRRFAFMVLATASVAASASAQPGSEHEKSWASCLNGNPDVAIKACTSIIEANAGKPAELATAFNSRGNAFYAKGQFDKAIEDLNRAIQLKPDYPQALDNRGNALLRKQQYDPAIKDFSEALRIKPDNAPGRNDLTPFDTASTFNNRGIAYLQTGAFNLAILDFNESVRINPKNADAFYNRGIAYGDNRDYESAVGDFTKALELNPKNALALYARGVARQNLHDAAGAEADRTAARQIDPEVAGKTAKSAAQAHSVVTPAPQAGITYSSVPDCSLFSDASPGSASQPQSAHGAAHRTYVEDSVEELRKSVPALHGVKFDEGLNGTDGAAVASVADRTASILDKTSAVTEEMMHRVPNLIAKEQVEQTIISTSQRLLSTAGRRQQFQDRSLTDTQYHDRVYNYRIVPKSDASIDEALDEFRTDSHDHPIADPDSDPDSPRSTGFATSWLFFVPGNLPESRFRYIGEQKIGNRETYVIAFAQIPGHTHIDTIVHIPTGGGCSTYSQGLAWIDESTYRIVRLQTDLLSPVTSLRLDKLRSVLNYGEVKIQKLDLALWLPSDVDTLWVSGDRTGEELHKYSNYRLFVSTMTILPPGQTSPQ
jgi:lipoprotein NlpI